VNVLDWLSSQAAGTSNPCDERGDAVMCEVDGCTMAARFLRAVPPRVRPSRAHGDVFENSIGGIVRVGDRSSLQQLCEHHITDWPFGPVSYQEAQEADQCLLR
jgi:hypothetical protein